MPVNSQFVLDATTHEHDLRRALGVPCARDTLAVEVALGWVLHMADGASPGLADELLALGVDHFDLLRACTGRRSRDEIAALGVDAARVERLLANSPLALPQHSLGE